MWYTLNSIKNSNMATVFILRLHGNNLRNIVYRHANFDYKQALPIGQFI
jgi:hypothetical protein